MLFFSLNDILALFLYLKLFIFNIKIARDYEWRAIVLLYLNDRHKMMRTYQT